MKKLKLLNKKYLLVILFYLLLCFTSYAQEPIDIWNVEGKKTTENIDVIESDQKKSTTQNSIYKMQSQKNKETNIKEDQAATFAPFVQEIMENTTKLPGVTLKAPPEIADNWKEGH